MKILFYSDTVFSFGGVQRVLAEIAQTLSKAHEVVILTTDCNTDLSFYDYYKTAVGFDYISYDRAISVQGLFCKGYSFLYKHVLPSYNTTSSLYAKSFFLPAYRKALIRKINEGRYDVVIGVHAFCSLQLAAIRDKIPAKVIGWMHNSYEAFFEKEHPYLPRLKDFFKYQMSRIDKVVVLSNLDKQKYIRELGLNAEVIYNPLTISPKGCASPESKRFLSVGRFSHGHKGFDLLIEAFALFAATHKEWKLDIVGEGLEEELYHEMIAKYRLHERIKIHPFTKDIHTYYMAAGVYVLSSRWEGMPLVLMEAMSYGLPVVASDIPIVEELISGKKVGALFGNGNVDQLADRLKYMAEQADLKEMGHRAANYAKEFEVNQIIGKWNQVIN